MTPALDEAEVPPGVELRDFDDHPKLRQQIFDGVHKEMQAAFPQSYGGVRMELHDSGYADQEDYSLAEQKHALLHDKFLGRRLRGTVKLFDDKTNESLEERQITLAKVPYLTDRGTFIHGGNEYTSVNQSRLLPGAYTRRQDNGELETQFNIRRGTGSTFRVGFEPETTQYRLRVQQANLHLYSLLHDMGVPDEQLKKSWGEEIFAANAKKYDSRVFTKAYERLVHKADRRPEHTDDDRRAALHAAFGSMRIHAHPARTNLPNLFDAEKSAEWQARHMAKEAAEAFEKRADAALEFAPDLSADHQVVDSSGLTWPAYESYHNDDSFLRWFRDYRGGKRTTDDETQKNRWRRFHRFNVPKFIASPSPARAAALRGWAIDPDKLLPEDQRAAFSEQCRKLVREKIAAEFLAEKDPSSSDKNDPMRGVNPEALAALRAMLQKVREQSEASGYNFYAMAEDPAHPGVGAEVSGALPTSPDTVIRKHIALHRDWAKEQGLSDVHWKQAMDATIPTIKTAAWKAITTALHAAAPAVAKLKQVLRPEAPVVSKLNEVFRPAALKVIPEQPHANFVSHEADAVAAHGWMNSASKKPFQKAFSYTGTTPEGASHVFDVSLGGEALGYAGNRQLMPAAITSRTSGQTWAQPFYRSSGNAGHGTEGQWLPFSEVHNYGKKYWAKADGLVPGFTGKAQARLDAAKAPAEFAMREGGHNIGWIGKHYWDPTTQGWKAHNKIDLPWFLSGARDAMGEYLEAATKTAHALEVKDWQRKVMPGIVANSTATEKVASLLDGIRIDQPKGSKKDLRDSSYPDYPLESYHYPTDYGSHPDYQGQDEADLDFFRGSGDQHGEFDVYRPDVTGELETKMFVNMTPEEKATMLARFSPVLRRQVDHGDLEEVIKAVERFRKPATKAASDRGHLPFRESAEALILDGDHIIGEMAPGANGKPFLKFPGGGIDDGETTEQGLDRELMEEAGVTHNGVTHHGVSQNIWSPAMAAAKPDKYAKWQGSRRHVYSGILKDRVAPTSGEGDALQTEGRVPILDVISFIQEQIDHPEDDADGSMLAHRKIQMTALKHIADTEKSAHALVHYSREKHDELRPLTYEELVKDRTSGRWEDQPDKAKAYVDDRKKFESALHKRLAKRGLESDPNRSFLYATLDGKEKFGRPGQRRHEAPLSDDLINSSFFDVVGDGKSRTVFGQRGLNQALKRWAAAEAGGNLTDSEYMGMPIMPRIEVMTQRSVLPSVMKTQRSVLPSVMKKASAEDQTDGEQDAEKSAHALHELQDAKARGDRGDMGGKSAILAALLRRYPDDFFVDSREGEYWGITHQPTGFRIHAPRGIVPAAVDRTR